MHRHSKHLQYSGFEAVTETEGVGFEPTDPFGSPVFKTGAINHSTTPPYGSMIPRNAKKGLPQLAGDPFGAPGQRAAGAGAAPGGQVVVRLGIQQARVGEVHVFHHGARAGPRA